MIKRKNLEQIIKEYFEKKAIGDIEVYLVKEEENEL
jgi:hypothetical protein